MSRASERERITSEKNSGWTSGALLYQFGMPYPFTLLRIAFLGVVVLSVFACQDDPTDTSIDQPQQETEQGPDAIAQIRSDYARAIKKSTKTIEFQCDSEPFAGTFTNTAADNLQWFRYAGGHEHGALALEALTRNGEIVFVMESESSWQFDPTAPDDYRDAQNGNEATIDTEIQERYYYQDGQLIDALYKKATARSIAGETIVAVKAKTKNTSHPAPKGDRALKKAKALLADYDAGKVTAAWCGVAW